MVPTSILIDVYLALVEVGTRLGESAAKNRGETTTERGPNTGTRPTN
jgi:hypothetical protein